ncbi:MAG: flagellar basal body-associated FliL family protein [Gemmatimonadales bacterium]|nr:flagellar basal body-associated FliL family protein [Gemmatimonadales bacterium]
MPTLGVALVALGAGFGVGMMVVGPRMASAAPGAEAEAGDAGGGHGPAAPAASALFTVDGLIVNPAGSRGQHHLIITVAFEVNDPAAQAKLRAAEVPLRDAISSLLERKTLDQLTAAGIREQLKGELAPLAAVHVGKVPVRVFVPQYIVQ